MKQKNLARVYLLVFGGSFFLVSCLQLVRFYAQRDDIWWTPVTSPLSLEQSRDRVEVYVRGVRLQTALQSGHLHMVGDSGPTAITASDIGIRLNNNDRVKVERLSLVVMSAAGAGFTGLVLLLGLLGLVPSRPMSAGASQVNIL